LIAVTAAVLLAAGPAACGLPEDESARPLGPDGSEILSDDTAPTTAGQQAARTFVLYLVENKNLVRQERPSTQPAEPATVIRSLLEGVTADEKNADRTSAIPPKTELHGVGLSEDGVLTVDLGRQMSTITSTSALTAYAQIVFTATGLEGVTAVHFLIDGQPVDAPTEQGNLEVARRSDYPELAPD
jgi:spore germination protein GerM